MQVSRKVLSLCVFGSVDGQLGSGRLVDSALTSGGPRWPVARAQADVAIYMQI